MNVYAQTVGQRIEIGIRGEYSEFKMVDRLAAAIRAVAAKIGQMNAGNIAELFRDVMVTAEPDEVGKISAAFDKNYVPEVRDVCMHVKIKCTVEKIDGENVHCREESGAAFIAHRNMLELVSRGEPVNGDQCVSNNSGLELTYSAHQPWGGYKFDTEIGQVLLDNRSDFRIIASAALVAELEREGK